ncbi:biotin carboxylase [Lysinibacillus composti]|uniref:ATP-grasp domain-containing protein n=1 Tax=Lysinibacillus composti TaxID=720633 RepID=A0A3N9UAF6_9BACI|nr:ATP-grasp domain-containing protein [Lysinibacillus composti]MBM7609927.1 biotin carboxylase [Lysinibacillus composti]RQW73457.1 ATP-grasp domain-containing protein [Lysinibacillus composti]
MRTIIFLHTTKSGSSREAIKAAEKLGYFTVLLTNSKNFIKQRVNFPDVHRMILVDLTNLQEIKKTIESNQRQGLLIEGIVSFVDPFVSLAVELHEEYCNGCLSLNAIKAMEDKTLTRELLKDLPCTPKFIKLNGTEFEESISTITEHLSYPLMIKSPFSTASRDVFKVENDRELRKSVKLLTRRYPDVMILIEEYLDGPQYLVETVVVNEEIHILAIFQQELVNLERFIITGYNLLNEIDQDFFETIEGAVKNIIETLELKTGACHLEIRIVENEVKLIEINPRISGAAMNRMIDIAYGINLVEETLKIQLGMEPNLTRKWEKHLFTKYIFVSTSGILEKVTGKKRALLCPGVEEVYIKPKKGTFLSPPKSMGQRYGYVIATGDTSELAKENAKNAAKEIRFHLNRSMIK